MLAERRGVELDVPEFEEAAAEADPMLVRQLMVIVLDNAVKFTPSRRAGVLASPVRAAGDASLSSWKIPASALPTGTAAHFDRFYRGGDARARANGAGLGLSIARWITDAHGASMTSSRSWPRHAGTIRLGTSA